MNHFKKIINLTLISIIFANPLAGALLQRGSAVSNILNQITPQNGFVGLANLLQLNIPSTYAQTTPATDCKTPDYTKLIDEWNKAETKDQNTYQDAFDRAQKSYHDYVGCLFDFAEKTVLMIQNGKSIIDWLKPDDACLKSTKIEEIFKKTQPDQMLGPVLEAHKKYKDHLKVLSGLFNQFSTVTDEQGNEIRDSVLQIKIAHLGEIRRNQQLEIDSSLLAIDLMFTSLKELRLSLVMHVHLQCTLQVLEKYRKALADLRLVIEPLPDQLRNASILK